MPVDAYNFILAWRWTQPAHSVLPSDVMAQITPIELIPEMDAQAHTIDVRTIHTDCAAADVNLWLRTLPVRENECVIVQWSKTTAIRTLWHIFARYWDDFCYPSSDDVAVFSPSDDWLLRYDHSEKFEWSRRQRV